MNNALERPEQCARAEDYGIDEPIGIVFCRNVHIYYDRPIYHLK
jgi:chemotaxis methyl-accepting protein methylase